MTERISLRPLSLEDKNLVQGMELARSVQAFVSKDFSRLGLGQEVVDTIADPDSPQKKARQLYMLGSAARKNVIYGGIYENNLNNGNGDNATLQGVVKVGPWTPEDAEPFGDDEVKLAEAEQKKANQTTQARGLGVFAVRSDLIVPALTAVYNNNRFVPYLAPFNAAVDDRDKELHAAFDELGAPKAVSSGELKLGDYEGTYTLRKLPARFTQHEW